MPWVKLRTIQYVEEYGVRRILYPGDWYNFGRQHAERLIACGDAWSPSGEVRAPPTAGVAVIGAVTQREVSEALQTVTFEGYLPFPFTLIWDTTVRLRTELLGPGFGLLDKWLMAVPLASYSQLACHIGDDEDRARTEAVIHDLRVPFYDCRMVFARRCLETIRFMAMWAEEGEGGSDKRLAFLRTYYRLKPTLCALPTSWVES